MRLVLLEALRSGLQRARSAGGRLPRGAHILPWPRYGPNLDPYNWPAFWAYDGSGNWLAGENDVAEALNWMEYNYSSDQSSGKLKPTGLWGNSWHVYGVYRSATSVQVFYDGVLMGTLATNDNGGPESIMFTSGKTNTCCGAPTAYGSTGNVLVDWCVTGIDSARRPPASSVPPSLAPDMRSWRWRCAGRVVGLGLLGVAPLTFQ